MLLPIEIPHSDQDAAADASRAGERCHLSPSEPASSAFSKILSVSVRFFHENDPKARAGEVSGVHQLRTTTRRIRTLLDLFQNLTDAAWNKDLAAELKWLSAWLGGVRDIDVLEARFQKEAKAIDAVAPLAPLFERLERRHHDASAALREVFQGDRYRALTTRLADAAQSAPLTEDAEAPCGKVLPRLVAVTWKRFRKAGRGLDQGDPDEPFHAVRKHAKRARYAAEAVKDALDHENKRAAQSFASRARLVQDVLGEHQDAVVAADTLRIAVDELPNLGHFGFAAGRLLEREIRASETSKARFFEVFPEIDRKKVVRWLQPS